MVIYGRSGLASAGRPAYYHPRAPTEQAEAEFVVHTIEQLLGGHSFFSMDSGRVADGTSLTLSFADVAVLYRTEAQAATLSEALARSGMPFQSRSHSPLSLHPGVPELRAWLQEATGPETVRQHLQAGAAHVVQTGAVDAASRAVGSRTSPAAGRRPLVQTASASWLNWPWPPASIPGTHGLTECHCSRCMLPRVWSLPSSSWWAVRMVCCPYAGERSTRRSSTKNGACSTSV